MGQLISAGQLHNHDITHPMPTPSSTMMNSQHQNYMSDNEHDNINDDANKYDKYHDRNLHAYAIKHNDKQPTSELHVRQQTRWH